MICVLECSQEEKWWSFGTRMVLGYIPCVKTEAGQSLRTLTILRLLSLPGVGSLLLETEDFAKSKHYCQAVSLNRFLSAKHSNLSFKFNDCHRAL